MEGHVPLFVVLLMLALTAAGVVAVLVLVSRVNRLKRQRDVLLEEKNVVFNFIYDVSEVFAEADSVDVAALLKKVVSYGLRVTGAKAGALYLLEADEETLRPAAVTGVFPPLAGQLDDLAKAFSKVRFVERYVRQRNVKSGEGLVGQVLARGVPILVANPDVDARVPRFEDDFLKIQSLLLVPMRFRHRVLGVLAVANRMDGHPFNDTDLNLLQALADQASISIHYAKFSAALDEKRRLDYDLGIARRIQASLLPRELPHLEGLEVAAFSVPAQQIGGDYYDFIQVDDHHVGLVIADVSGKGISGAIVMSICRSLLRTTAPGCLSPAAVLRAVNRTLSHDLAEDMFVSILYLVMDLRTHELTLARGGHEPPILCPRGGLEPVTIAGGGVAMGLAGPDVFDSALEERTLSLRRGDCLVLYTDGVTEAHDRQEQEWGLLNLVQTVQGATFDGVEVAQLASRVQQKLLQFGEDVPQYDDMTLVALRVMP